MRLVSYSDPIHGQATWGLLRDHDGVVPGALLQDVVPGEDLQVNQTADAVILSGNASNNQVALRAGGRWRHHGRAGGRLHGDRHGGVGELRGFAGQRRSECTRGVLARVGANATMGMLVIRAETLFHVGK